MQSLWAQHKTIVAQRSLEAVRSLFRREGKQLVVQGKAPLLLRNPAHTFFVQKGQVDLFLVDLVRGSPMGRRFHFVRVHAGELILGMEPLPSNDPDHAFGIIAVGMAGTALWTADRARLQECAQAQHVSDALHGAVDRWVQRLSEGLSDHAPPAERIEALPTGRVVYEPGTVICASPKTIWFRQFEGTSKLVGVSPIRPKRTAMLPLTRQTWLEIETTVTMAIVDSQTYFRWDPQWTSVERFHRVVLDCLGRRALNAREVEVEQLRARERASQKSVQRALSGLATITKSSAVMDVGVHEEPGVLMACRRIGHKLGVPIEDPGEVEGGVRAEDIAQASRLRLRTVLLPTDWMKAVREPMLGFLGSFERPVALLPRQLGGFKLYDPSTGETVRATAKTTAELNPSAYVFYRPLPARVLSLWDILKFSSFGIKRDLLVVLFTGLLLGGMAMVVPWATGKMIDDLIPSADKAALFQLGGMLVVLATSTALVQIVRGAVAMRLQMRSSASLQAAVWDRLLALPVPFFRRFAAADLALRANSIETLREALSGGTLTAMLMSLSSLLNFAVMVAYSAKLALIAAGLAMVNVVFATIVGVRSVLVGRELAEIEGRLSSLVLQLIGGITKLRVAGAERRAFALWAQRFVKKRILSFTARKIDSRMAVVSAVWPTLMSVAIFQAVAQGETQTMGTGAFLAFNAAFGIFVGGLVELARTGVNLLDVVPIVERAKPLFLAKPETNEQKTHPGKLRGAIQISHVSFRYTPEGPLILDDVNFEIAPGEFVAIVGASAAGKSTLLRIMLGFEHPESGGVFFDRQELSSLDATEVRRQMGVVLQSGQPVAGDILENIFASRRLTVDDAWEAARMAGLDQDIDRMPMKMHTVLGQGAPSLSGGQRQRLMIARAVVTKPRILFFDEATSALDNNTQAQVTQSLERLQATRVVVAHRLSTIKNADKIVVMERGRVVQLGTYEELVEVDGVFKDIARRQIT